MRLLCHPSFLAVSLSHFYVDVLNSQVGILLAVFSVPLMLTNASIGLIATCVSVVGALSQPLFGWLVDRFGERWAIAGGVLWMGVFYSLVAVTPGYLPLVFLVAAALGSAAVHPAGAKKATQLGNVIMAGQAATAASMFFLLGQGGLSLGPAIAGLVLDTLGRGGLLIVTLACIPLGIFAAAQLNPSRTVAATELADVRLAGGTTAAQPHVAFLIIVMALAGMRTWVQMATTTFAPKYFHDLGLPATYYGLIVAMFMGGSAMGGVLGAMIADRWGRRRAITFSLALSAPPIFFLPFGVGIWIYLLAFFAGLLNGAPHSILVVMAQRSMPGRAALASGIILGSMFTLGALGAYVSGLAADSVGLAPVLQANAALSLVAAVISMALLLEKNSPAAKLAPTGD